MLIESRKMYKQLYSAILGNFRKFASCCGVKTDLLIDGGPPRFLQISKREVTFGAVHTRQQRRYLLLRLSACHGRRAAEDRSKRVPSV